MPPIGSRRKLLQRGGAVLFAGLAGCVSSTDSNSSSEVDCDLMHTAVLKAIPIDGPPKEQQSPEIISFADLPTKEREIARIAIEEEEYKRCYFDLPPAEQDTIESQAVLWGLPLLRSLELTFKL